jgi:predicted lipoprotein with Yx(FWY)xxD motif
VRKITFLALLVLCLAGASAGAAGARPTAGFGTEKKLNGTLQVTYAGHPLDYFAGYKGGGAPDRKPGQLNGQGLYDAWYVVSPSGKTITKRVKRTLAVSSAGAVVKVAYNKTLKRKILVDARGMTLYYFMSDYKGQSACTDDPTYHCSKAWPPLTTTDPPTAGAGAQASLLGTVTRSDTQQLQVTYAGHLLYTFHGYQSTPPDRKPGDIHGQGFIALWYVLSPTGKPIKK